MKQRPRKKIWGAAFMLALVVSILPAVLLNADAGSGAHDHTSSDWVYLTASDTVIVDDSVYYCLNDAVTLDYGLSIGDGGNECTVTLCLNGQTLSCADYGPTVTVRDGATLILCDCQGGGAVEAPDGDVISVEEGGKLILQSGTITAGELSPELYDPEFPPEVTGVSLSGGEFEMVGGEIADCYIGVHMYDGEFDMTGGTIKDCETGVSAEGEYESDYWEVFDGVLITGGVPSISESHLVTARQLTFPVFTMTDGTIETCQTGVFAKHAVFNMSGDAFIHACNGYGVSLDCAYEAYYAGSFDFFGDPISSYIP
ncbi:MAG: hypothetical protein IJF15_04600, partial [Oscillospiraceae bacterium]|nr:hypothetical protein [Oscillospiraceae bacterium]